MNFPLTCAISPCPNDTFIFHALFHGKIPCGDLRFDVAFQDVETLNRAARKGKYMISKLSFAAFGHLRNDYALLRSGAALGRGCGPILVARPGIQLKDIDRHTIAVPGKWTTACLLLGLFLKKAPHVEEMPFHLIMPEILRGDSKIGVIIHESRFTYAEYGLIKLMDLGEWWEQETSMPIPLGGIAIRRDLVASYAALLETAISDSVRYAFAHPEASRQYVQQYAQEMDPDVIRSHIQLYVNDFSVDIGPEGEHAVRYLYERAARERLLPESNFSIFATDGCPSSDLSNQNPA